MPFFGECEKLPLHKGQRSGVPTHVQSTKWQPLSGYHSQSSKSQTKAMLCDINHQRMIDPSDLQLFGQLGVHNPTPIVIIENINLEWIEALKEMCNIDPGFFSEHAADPPGPSPWNAVFGRTPILHRRPSQTKIESCTKNKNPNEPADNVSQTRAWWHIDGVFALGHPGATQLSPSLTQASSPIRRRKEYHQGHGMQVSACISHYRVGKVLHLFLVDPPPAITQDDICHPLKLHLPVSNSRGGLLLPQLLGKPYHSLFQSLQHFFSHAWHIETITDQILSPETIMYLWATSTMAENLKFLDGKIKRLAFEDIRRPSIRINDQLHDCRQSLTILSEQVSYTKKWMPHTVQMELETVESNSYPGGYVGFPDTVLGEIRTEGDRIEKFLMDTFQLLVSSVNVLDSEKTFQQARSGQKLTQLAFVYIPLSFVTGIFGMNIQEINGSPIRAWVCLVVLLVTITCTVAIFAAYNKWGRRENE
ncbi:hypothetical protein PG989_015125 [Apiospora arundinis]